MKRILTAAFFVVLAAGLVFLTGCGGKKSAEPSATQEAAAQAESLGEPAAAAAEEASDEPSGPIGEWPESFMEDLKAAEGIRIYDRLPDHVIKALIKTPKDLKAKSLEKEAEEEVITNKVAMVTLMNGWVTPSHWKEAREMALAGLRALAILQDLAKDPGRADRSAVIQEVAKILKPADISEADLKRIHENQAALTKALEILK